ncbi:unnamed protein product [Paramecium sonneborni]|uniref:P-loop containing nucleoside triphosphate hydrolase n=1 Tax=Paramecium sonneborni TaxID=65129 RepID=A0A8S1NR52_9CILI|nr:unnamed protein product [Paramecium sonneborni]
MESQHPFIVLILGDCNSGKSTIVGRYLENKLVDPQPTIGVVKRDSQIEIGNSNQKAQIFDTSGNEKFRDQVLAEFKNASAVVLVYDITDYQSFQNIQTLQKEVTRQNPNIDYWIIVGNKLDLKEQRKVQTDEGKKFASQIGARFIECSAQQPSNINLIFLTIQQWTLINIQPKYVPEQTQRLLEKLNNDESSKQLLTSASKNNQTKFKNRNTSFSLIQNNTNNVVSQSFDEQQNSFNGDNLQDYFTQLYKKVDLQNQKLADVIVEEAQDNVIQSLKQETITIQNTKPLYLLENNTFQLQEKIQDKINMMKKKHKQLDKLRKEIAQNLLLIQEQRKKLTADQVIENTQTQKLERELQKRLLSVERNMDFLKTDIILSQKSQKFSTNKNNFLSIDQTQILKQHINQIQNPEHIKEQNDQIQKIKTERKKLEEQRNNRYKQHVDNLESLQKQEKEIRLKNEQDLIQKRKEKAMNKIASMDQIRQERSQQLIKQNEQVKQIIGTTPLHVKLENLYQEKITNPQLEEHKLKLKQIRDLHQPVRMNDLKQWEENYDKRKKSQEEVRNQKIFQNNQLSYQASYESSAYKQVKDEQSKQQKEKEYLLKEQQSKQQAKQEFQNKLKDYIPSISPEKQQELEQIINKVHHKINFYEFIEMTKKVKLKGVFFDKDGKILERSVDEEYYEKIKENEKNEEQNPKVIGNKYLNDVRRIIKKPSLHESVDRLQSQSNPEQGYQLAVRNPKQNKLNEIKSHWKLKPKLTFEETDLQKIIDGNEVAGFSNQHVMQQANKLASEAVKQLQIIEAKGEGKICYKDIESADKLLINSIKAKLTLMEKELKSENRGQEISTNQKRGRSNTKQHS